MHLRRVTFVLLLALVSAGFVADWYALPAEVEQHVVTPRFLPREVIGPGLLDAMNRVVITARTHGFLVSIDADRNDRVKRGQILARLESADLSNQLIASQSEAEALLRAVSEAESERERVEAALAKAKLNYNRCAALAKLNVGAQADFATAEPDPRLSRGLELDDIVLEPRGRCSYQPIAPSGQAAQPSVLAMLNEGIQNVMDALGRSAEELKSQVFRK